MLAETRQGSWAQIRGRAREQASLGTARSRPAPVEFEKAYVGALGLVQETPRCYPPRGSGLPFPTVA